MILPKNKIRLSRHLYAQTTPYPEVRRWMKRAIVLGIILIAVATYFVAKPRSKDTNGETSNPTGPKQILGEQSQTPQPLLYEIKKGDTLFNVSSRYGYSWQTIAELNNLKAPYLLKVGQKIKIPAKQ